MECYTIELADRAHRPHLKAFARTYILTLSETRTFPSLYGITAETYIQRNRGFVQCPKLCDDGLGYVSQTYMDITHAYKSLFQRVEHIVEPILVLEDDAELMSTAIHDWEAVDRFIAQSEWIIYSLGSFGMVLPHRDGHWRYLDVPTFGPIQSVIYSHSARARIMGASACENAHLDMGVISRISQKFTFHRPITHQKLRDTANSRSWCIVCNGGYADRIFRAVSQFMIRQCGLVGDSERGFARVYQLQKLFLPVLLVCTALLTYWTLACIDACLK